VRKTVMLELVKFFSLLNP